MKTLKIKRIHVGQTYFYNHHLSIVTLNKRAMKASEMILYCNFEFHKSSQYKD